MLHKLSYKTAGESYGAAVTVILEGVPRGLALDIDRIDAELRRSLARVRRWHLHTEIALHIRGGHQASSAERAPSEEPPIGRNLLRHSKQAEHVAASEGQLSRARVRKVVERHSDACHRRATCRAPPRRLLLLC